MARLCCGRALCPLLLLVFAVLALVSYRSDSASHWVLKRSGHVTARPHSVFNLRQPNDLLAFIQQEEYSHRLRELNQVLKDNRHKLEKADIEKEDDKQVEADFFKTDKDCLSSPRRLGDLDLYSSTYLPLEKKGIKMSDHLSCPPGEFTDQVPQVPDCRKPVLDFSPRAFEHLPGIQARTQLPIQPEPALHGAFPDTFAMQDLGICLRAALEKNATSWVLLNVASIYWRIHGHYHQASECLRRALHFSPARHRDVALLSMANILHRSQHSKDAVILLLSAIDLSPHLFIHHFTLGNVHAVNREWNLSAESYMRAHRIEPTITTALESKHAVRCQQKLEELLTQRQQALESTLRDLEEYQAQHWEFQDIHQRFSDNILLEDPDFDPFFGPLNAGLDDDVVGLGEVFKSNATMTAQSFASTSFQDEEDQDDEEGDTDARGNDGGERTKPSSASGLGQCPAGPEVRADPPVDSSPDTEEMCSADEAIHHGQSRPGDAPEEEKDQCLVTEVTTEEIEDLRSRIDWVAGSDLADSTFSVEQAREEFEKIINSLDDADPQLIALVKERLKSLSSNRLGLQDMNADDLNLFSAYEKLTGRSCEEVSEDDEALQLDSCASAFAGEDADPQLEADNVVIPLARVKLSPPKGGGAAAGDDVVIVTPDVTEDEEDANADMFAYRRPSKKSADRPADVQASSKPKLPVKYCQRPRIWIMRMPEMNAMLEARDRVPCIGQSGRPAKSSLRVCNRYGEEKYDKLAVEIDQVNPPGLDFSQYPFVFDRREEKDGSRGDGSDGEPSAPREKFYVDRCQQPPVLVKGQSGDNPSLPPTERVPCNTDLVDHQVVKNSVGRRHGEEAESKREEKSESRFRLSINQQRNPEFNPHMPPEERVPCMSDGTWASVDRSAYHRAAGDKRKEREIQAAATAAVEKVVNEMIKANSSLPGNRHPPKLVVRSPNNLAPEPPVAKKSSSSDKASDKASEAEARWIQEQTRFVDIAEEKRRDGPLLPRYMAKNTTWDKVYGNYPRTVIAMVRRADATAEKVLLERQTILSKIQLLPLDNAKPMEEVLRFDEDAGMPVYAAPEVTKEECDALPATPTWDHFPAVYLPPEIRGVNVSELLAVGLPPSHIHPHPYTPPICVHYAALPHSMKAYDHLLGIQYRDQLPMVPEPTLNNLVASLVDPENTLEEIGQRLTTAFEMSPQPAHWALFHIAGLFFRVVGNPFHALECFRRAVHYAPLMARDVPLLGIGEMLHRAGQMSDATVVLHAALDIHPEQALLHFALGNAYSSNGQYQLARLHHSYACTRQPSLLAACLAVRYDECYSRRDVPPEIVNAAYRQRILPSCTLTKCHLSDTPLRRKYEVITHQSMYLGSPELPEVIYHNDSVMRKHFGRLANDFVNDARKRLATAREEQMRTAAQIREMVAEDQKRIDVLLHGHPSPPLQEENAVENDIVAVAMPDDASSSASKSRLSFTTPPLTEETCNQVKDVNLRELTSTWLSVEVKEIQIGDHIDITTPEPPAEREKRRELFPVCKETIAFSAYMMDHLEGIQDRQRFEHVSLSEPGLSQVLLGLGGKSLSISTIAARIDDALKLNATSWVLQNLAALVWRVKGRGDHAIRCLRQVMHYSPRQYRDIGLVSLANVMARSRLFRDSLILMSMALEISPHFVVHHFTIANILAATDNLKEAEFFYRNTLTYQPNFQPAAQRYMAVRCKLQQQGLKASATSPSADA